MISHYNLVDIDILRHMVCAPRLRYLMYVQNPSLYCLYLFLIVLSNIDP